MTVSTISSIAEFVTNGVTTNYPFYFKFLANEDLVVTYVSPTGVSSVLTLGTQYTANGAGNDQGGSVVTTTALAGPGQLIVSREMDAYQQTSLRNQGKFLAETHEDVFDRLTMLIQQGFAGIGRALKRPIGKAYFDAESRLISNVADPVADQDAATKGWAGRYFGSLIDGATGLINTTTGILYDAGTLFEYLRYGLGRNVDSIAALRLLTSGRNQRAFVLGYYARGDGGGGSYYIDPADTTSADNGGTIIVGNDGARWKLSYQGMISVKQFGAKGDSLNDDSFAIVKAQSSSIAVYYPPGTYRCANKVTLAGQVTMLGAGPKATSVLFDGVTQGFDITQNTSGQIFDISNLAFLTTDSTASFTGLRINGIPQLTTNTDGLRFYLGDRNKSRGNIRNVMFSGASNASGWGVGLNMECMMNYQIENVTYTGQIPAIVGNLTGCAILLNGDGGGTDIRIRGLWVFYALYSVLIPDYMEGIHINDYEFVVVTYGIVGRYTPGYSKLPAASSGALSLYAHQGHINCLQGGIILEKANGNFIETQNIYLQPRAADGIAFGVLVNGGNDHRLRDIYVSGDSAANVKANNYAVLLQGVGLSFVDSVTASSLQSAVTLSGSSFNEVMNLQARACVSVCVGDGGSTQNSVGPGRSSSITGAKYQVALDNNIRMDEYATFVSRTLAAGASATISIPLPAGTFTEAPRFATISIDSSSIYYRWQYLRSSSSSSQVTFLLEAASPASSIPAETIEVSVNAKGI